MKWTDLLSLKFPIIQAPMAGISTPNMAAAVSNAGALGSISVGAAGAGEARKMIADVRLKTDRPFNVNVFCHRPAIADAQRESAWLDYLRPHFEKFNAMPPEKLREIYTTFQTDDAMLQVMLESRPAVVSFHFGIPPADRIAALKAAGIFLLATATNVDEGRQIAAAGIDGIVAQGHEAGGHHGMFDAEAFNHSHTLGLTQRLAREFPIPVISAGGIMNGAHIAAHMIVGGAGAQLGTAFVGCPESSASAAHRAALFSASAETVVTRVISGRRAGCLVNHFTAIGDADDLPEIPDYPIAYDAGKALNAAAIAAGEFGYGAQWAGRNAAEARALPAAELVERLGGELRAARG